MAFNIQGLSLSSYSTNEAAPKLYTYFSGLDTIDAIRKDPSYFSLIAPQCKPHDWMYICSTLAAPDNDDPANTVKHRDVFVITDVYWDISALEYRVRIQELATGFRWENVTEDTIMNTNTGYIILSQPYESITLTMPDCTNAEAGDWISIVNQSGSTATIQQIDNQRMGIGKYSTTLGTSGYIKMIPIPDGDGGFILPIGDSFNIIYIGGAPSIQLFVTTGVPSGVEYN